MDRIDRMGIHRTDDTTDASRYGSLYLVEQRKNNVNDYGGAVDDVEKLSAITNAAAGSTCLFTNGDIYRLELDGWAKFGETGEETAATTSVNPLDATRSVTRLNTDTTDEFPEVDDLDIQTRDFTGDFR